LAKNTKAPGWGLKLLVVVLTLVVAAAVFSATMSATGNATRAGMHVAMAIGGGLIASYILGMIKPLRNKRWHIYILVAILVAAYLASNILGWI